MAGASDPTFNYSQWTKNTVLTMCNVRWDNTYQDVVRFDTQDDLDMWIDDQPNITITKFSLAKFQRDVRVDTPFNKAMKYNYLRAVNDVPGDDEPMTYYYFVTGIEYINPKVTRLNLQLDVFQTFGYDIQFGLSFLERGHLSLANTNQFQQYGRSYLTVPEGLDVGGEYRIVHTEHEKIMDTIANDVPTEVEAGYDILVCATLDLTQDPLVNGNPGIKSAPGTTVQGLPSGAMFYLFKSGVDLGNFFTAYTAYPWITQSIISITMIPNMKRYNPDYDYGPNLSSVAGVAYYDGPRILTGHAIRKVLEDWRDELFISNILGSQYASLKKFLTYPYMMIEMTSFNGSPLIIKPESWQDPDATVREMIALMPPGQRIMMSPNRYNADAETSYSIPDDNGAYPVPPASGNTQTDSQNESFWDDFGEFINFATTLDNFPTLPIVNNMALAYLAQNKNGIAFSFANAEWGRTRGYAAAQAGADVANAQIGNSARQAGIGIQNASQQMAIQSNAQTAQGIARGLTRGAFTDPIGGASDIALGAMQASAGIESANADIQARGASANSDIQTAGQVRDTNQQFADFAAQGDYENDIRGVQAKIQDSAMIQPSVSGQFGGDAFNIIHNLFGYSLRWKMPPLSVLRQIGNHWLSYGYAVQQYVTPPANLRCMSKFTYWKMLNVRIISGNMPEGFKQTLRGILQNGVTVWADPDDIGVTALNDNEPLPGFSY